MENDRDQDRSAEAAQLRRLAEERLRDHATELPPRTDAETQRLVHELEVHQIELEMQNAELRQARDEVEKTLGEYSDLYDFAPTGYMTLDRDGTIRTANLTAASLLGIERARLIGRSFGLFVAVEDRHTYTAFLDKVFANKVKESCDLALLTGVNPRVFVLIEAAAAVSGEECRVAIVDITTRRQLEKELEILHSELATRAAELEAANIELEAFNYSASHDLRGPLAVIVGYCDVVADSYGNHLDEKGRGFIRQIQEGAMSMNRLIDTLLNFSCVKRIDLCQELVDLSKMAEDVARGLQIAEPERRATFRIAAGIEANGDATLLRVVLDNLFGNAWKYSRKREETVIAFGGTEVAGKPVYFVRDNGQGFDMAHAGKLFIPFQRLPGSAFEGHGIGLATVDRIVRRHGGRVWAESNPDEGATFYFTLE
ncbi:MAG: ATP-binding protein [Desulfuromonadales bacterium]|nr:ATP-binding protein [Desulfuromonadales bacterium]